MAPLATALEAHGEEYVVAFLERLAPTSGLHTYSKTSLRDLIARWAAAFTASVSAAASQAPTGALVLSEPKPDDARSIISATYSQYELLGALLQLVRDKAKRGGVEVLDGLGPPWLEARLCHSLCIKSPRNLMDAIAYIEGLDGGGSSLVRTGEEERYFLKTAYQQAFGIYVCERWATGIIEVTDAPEESSVIIAGKVDVDVSQPYITNLFSSTYLTVVKSWCDLCRTHNVHVQTATFVAYCRLYGGAAMENIVGHMEDKGQFPSAHMIPRVAYELYGENPWVIAHNKVKERINLLANEAPVGLMELLNGAVRFHTT